MNVGIFGIAALTALVSVSGIATADGNYYTDRRTGCRLWTPYFHPDATVQWSGACRNGLAEGSGVLTLSHSIRNEQGDVEVRIEGTYSGGRLNGRALITYDANGKAPRFEGTVQDGIKNGRGRFTVPGFGYFDGNYINDNWQGYGELLLDKSCTICADPGSQYKGDWVNGKYQGKGILVEANGDRYEGEFVGGKLQGKGVYVRQNGDRYEGEWGNGRPNGMGTKTWDHGSKRYSGRWVTDCSMDSAGRMHSFLEADQSCEVMRDYFKTWVR